MQNPRTWICIMFFQLQGDEYLPRTDFFQKGKSISVGTCRLHLRIIGLGIKAYKHNIIVKHHITSLYVRLFGKVENLVISYLIIDHFVSFLLIFPVGDDVGNNNLVVNHKPHITGKHLITILQCPRAIDLYPIFQQYAFKASHLFENIFFMGIYVMQYGLV